MAQAANITHELIKVNCLCKAFRKLLLYPTELPGLSTQIRLILRSSHRPYSRLFPRFPKQGRGKQGNFSTLSPSNRDDIASSTLKINQHRGGIFLAKQFLNYDDVKHCVYMLAPARTNPERVKIGFTSDLKKRVRQIQAASGERLEPIWFLQCSPEFARDIEKQIHIVLHRWRLYGEWFQFCPEVYGIGPYLDEELAGLNLA